MRFCSRCVYPEIAVNLLMDDEGVCSACRAYEEFKKLSPEFWAKREARFRELLESYRNKKQDNYDCIIPVSGGKDSYWQTHLIKNVYKLNLLLVTYHGNRFLPEGEENLNNMRHVFGVDHQIFRPSTEMLKKLNRAGFIKTGDMNWHNHCGIYSYPVQMAAKLNIPLIIWGETPWDISGMFGADDFPEMSARERLEHGQRGFDWFDFVGQEGLEAKDLLWARYPSDEEIRRVGIRGVYVGNFIEWDETKHSKLVEEKYGFQKARQPFDRTYRLYSNLDDIHENGGHDYLKWIKFGYGRASDHASKDIRKGYMTRETGVDMVRKYDHVKSADVYNWLDYVGISEAEFDRIADSYRDKRVWKKDAAGQWMKHNLWDAR